MNILSFSYGKDSFYTIELCFEKNIKVDKIITCDVMATQNISADFPIVEKYKKKADKFILDRYGLTVEHYSAPLSYEEYFYTRYKRGQRKDKIYGFPLLRGPWCNDRLKTRVLNSVSKNNVSILGIACDEKSLKRQKDIKLYNQGLGKYSVGYSLPLVDYNISENYCLNWCKEHNILNPVYYSSFRGGCWFCHNQSKKQLYFLYKNYHYLWDILLNWDKDSPRTFKPDGMTVKDYDNLFKFYDNQIMFDL